MECAARGGQTVGVATGHEHARSRSDQLFAGEVPESGIGPGDEVGATGQVVEVLRIPALFGSWHDFDPTPGEVPSG